MPKHTMPNQWTLAALKNAVGVLPRPREWRLMEPALYGQVVGLPGSTGIAVATNGVLVIIIRESGPFLGHLASFVEFDDGSVAVRTRIASANGLERAASSRKKTTKNKIMIDFV